MSQQYFYSPFNTGNDANEALEAKRQLEQRALSEKKEIRKISFSMGCAIVAYLIIQTVFSLAISLLNLEELYRSSAIFQYAFTIIGVSVSAVAVPFGIMALFNKKKYEAPIIPSNKVKPLMASAWVFFGLLCCIGANIAVSVVILLTKGLGYQLTQGETSDPDSIFACVLEFVALAVVPAICEEFAMRCCSLQLLKKYGTGFSVFAVSIVFGLLHGNVIQFLFAFAIGVVLAFVTVKTESIVPAIIIHAINNSMSVMQSILTTYSTDKISDYATICLYIVIVALGAVSAVYLAIKKQFSKSKTAEKTALTNGQKFSAFLFPWMIVPFLCLVALTITTIKKI